MAPVGETPTIPSPVPKPLPPAKSPWVQRLQHVRLRTKIVAPMVVLAAGPLLAIGASGIAHLRSVLRENALERLDFDASVKARAIEEFLDGVREDLLFLGRGRALRELASAGGDWERIAKLRREVEDEFLRAGDAGKRDESPLRRGGAASDGFLPGLCRACQQR